jgi:hypothetical protein
MQSAQLSDSSSGESERVSTAGTPAATEGFSFSSDDIPIMRGYIQTFQNADTETRKKILETVMGEIYALRPPDFSFSKRKAKKVCFRNSMNSLTQWSIHGHR